VSEISVQTTANFLFVNPLLVARLSVTALAHAPTLVGPVNSTSGVSKGRFFIQYLGGIPVN
jgi:hypothetical protein